MSNIGYREIMDLDKLSLKQLNDNLRALWDKVMGDISQRDLSGGLRAALDSKAESADLSGYSTLAQTAAAIEAKVEDLNLSQYATVTQTAAAIEAKVEDLNLSQYATVTQTAAAIDSKVEDLNLSQYATVTQTAAAIDSRVEDLNLSQYATVTQTASAITAALADSDDETHVKITASGGLTVTQSSTSNYFQANASRIGFFSGGGNMLGGLDASGRFVASAIANPAISAWWAGFAYSTHIGSPFYGLNINNGSAQGLGGFHADNAGNVLVNANGGQLFLVATGGGRARVGSVTHPDGALEVLGHVIPESDGVYSLGAPSISRRWKNVNITGSVNQSSDRRLKTDVAALGAAGLLPRLRPRRFRMRADGRKLRFGFVAQEVRAALEAEGFRDAALLDDKNPSHLSLAYGELIAVLVEGWQQQQARIKNLEARLTRLEASRSDEG